MCGPWRVVMKESHQTPQARHAGVVAATDGLHEIIREHGQQEISWWNPVHEIADETAVVSARGHMREEQLSLPAHRTRSTKPT